MSTEQARTVVALLANPPTTSGARTRAKASQAADLLGGGRLIIANLFGLPTADLPSLSHCGSSPAGWRAARPKLIRALQEADCLVAAWGLHPLCGDARRLRQEQLTWLQEQASKNGLLHAWCVGGQPRHPSRWHQYVSDRHGRTTGGIFSDRLDQVLVRLPMQVLTSPHAQRSREMLAPDAAS